MNGYLSMFYITDEMTYTASKMPDGLYDMITGHAGTGRALAGSMSTFRSMDNRSDCNGSMHGISVTAAFWEKHVQCLTIEGNMASFIACGYFCK